MYAQTKQRTQIYLSKKQIHMLNQAVQKTDTTLSGIIRMYLGEKLDSLTKKPGKPSVPLLTAAKQINRLGKAGPKDLASNLDRFLYE